MASAPAAARSFTSARARRYADGGLAPQGAPMPGGPGGDPGMGGGTPGPEAGGGGDPTQQLQAAVGQYAQTKDPQLAVQIADMLVSLMGAGQSSGAPGADPGMGGGAPAGGGAPMPAGPGPQMAAKGGKLRQFGKQPVNGEKPTFGAPGKDFRGKGNTQPNPKGGKPMGADEKLRAKRAAMKK